jgi:hypothetical protein
VEEALLCSDESPFWKAKAMPLVHAVLSVLKPLQEQELLFSPEGIPSTDLNVSLFLLWCDLYSLRSLAFTLQRSNREGKLYGTQYNAEHAARYHMVDLEVLGSYLSGYMVDLENEMVDFPITHYNLHVGITDVLKKLL